MMPRNGMMKLRFRVRVGFAGSKKVLIGEFHTKVFNFMSRLCKCWLASRCVVLLLVLSPTLALAEMQIGVDFGLLQDQNTISSQSTVSNTYYDLTVYLQALKAYGLFLGLDYAFISSSQPVSAAATATLSSSNPLLGAKYFFGKDKIASITIAGSPLVEATYSVTGATSDVWSGSAFLTKLALHPNISKSVKVSLAIVYYSATYNSKSSTSSSTTLAGFSRTLLIPTMGLQFAF
jgi:hypothetical protein